MPTRLPWYPDPLLADAASTPVGCSVIPSRPLDVCLPPSSLVFTDLLSALHLGFALLYRFVHPAFVSASYLFPSAFTPFCISVCL